MKEFILFNKYNRIEYIEYAENVEESEVGIYTDSSIFKIVSSEAPIVVPLDIDLLDKEIRYYNFLKICKEYRGMLLPKKWLNKLANEYAINRDYSQFFTTSIRESIIAAADTDEAKIFFYFFTDISNTAAEYIHKNSIANTNNLLAISNRLLEKLSEG